MQRLQYAPFVLLLLFVFHQAYTAAPALGAPSSKTGTPDRDAVKGSGCYSYGDNETPAQAKRAAMSIAQEQAVRSHRVFVQSESKIKNFQLDEDVIQTASAAMLEQVKVEQEEKKGQEICVTISALISPVSIEDMIRQRVNAKEISQMASSSVVTKTPSFGVRLWTNNPEGRFVEGDRLIIHVQSERDAYLKLDYFQADGTVVHMVPNKFRGQAFIKGGRTYAFGDDAAPEHFIVQEPFGDEAVKAILSTSPFDSILNEATDVGDSRRYLRGLSTSRGLVVKPAEHSVSVNTMSKKLEEYKRERPTSAPK